MFSLLRRTETLPDASKRHEVTLGLIEQVTELRGRVRAMETEWDDIRLQIKKGFQRMEKANQRAEARAEESDDDESPPVPTNDGPPLQGFAKKLAELRGS